MVLWNGIKCMRNNPIHAVADSGVRKCAHAICIISAKPANTHIAVITPAEYRMHNFRCISLNHNKDISILYIIVDVSILYCMLFCSLEACGQHDPHQRSNTAHMARMFLGFLQLSLLLLLLRLLTQRPGHFRMRSVVCALDGYTKPHHYTVLSSSVVVRPVG